MQIRIGKEIACFISLFLLVIQVHKSDAQQSLQILDDPIDFSEETSVQYFSSDAYEREPSTVYPDEPAVYFRQLQEARRLYNIASYNEAAPIFETLVEQYPDNGSVWLLLGLCQEELAQQEKAIKSFKEAISLGASPSDKDLRKLYINSNYIMLKIGLLYAETGNEDEAIVWIKKSIEARLSITTLLSDDRRALLMNNPEFRELIGLSEEIAFGRNEEWQRDIDFLGSTIKSNHYDPDHRSSSQEINTALKEVKNQVSQLSDPQIIARLSLIMGKVGAGHDLLLNGTGNRGSMDAFAIKAYFFIDGLFIIEAEDSSLIGAKIEKIGNYTTAEALAILEQNMAKDNNMSVLWSAPKVIRNPWLLEVYNLVDSAESATFSISDIDGKKREVRPALGNTLSSESLSGLSPQAITGDYEIPAYLARMNEFYYLEKIESLDSLYIQMNSIQNDADETLNAFSARLQEEAASPDIKHLILDLRHNSGGSAFLLPGFIRALANFVTSDKNGEVFVIIGRNTFSSAQILITNLDEYIDPIFVGEPSGSRPNAIGEFTQFTLPYSGLMGSLSSQYYQSAFPQDHRIWTAPDLPVGLYSEDYFSGRDPSLQAIENVIAEL